MDRTADNSQPPAPPTQESRRAITGQALKFLGLMLTVGGSLAGLRTQGLPEYHWIYVLFIPAGLIVWGIGFYLCGTAAVRENRHGQ